MISRVLRLQLGELPFELFDIPAHMTANCASRRADDACRRPAAERRSIDVERPRGLGGAHQAPRRTSRRLVHHRAIVPRHYTVRAVLTARTYRTDCTVRSPDLPSGSLHTLHIWER